MNELADFSKERRKNIRQLESENAELRRKYHEAESTLAAIKAGEVDGLVVNGDDGEQVFTLKTAEHPYRVFVETMNEGAATVTEDGVIIFCNKCFAEMLGLPLSKVPGTKIQSYIDRSEMMSFDVLFESGKIRSSRGEFHLVSKTDRIPVQLSFAKVEMDEIAGVCLVATDLREKKQKEALAKDYEWLEKLLNLMPTPVLIFEKANGGLYLANHAADELFGDDLLKAKSWSDFASYELLDKNGNNLPIEKYPVIRAARGELVRGQEFTRRTAKGDLALLGDAEVLPQMYDRPETIVLTLQNVTKLKQVEDELARASLAKSEFLANMSHEIRTPLGAVLGFAELLADKTLSDEEKENFLNVISRNGNQLSNLIDDILDLSKIEAGKIEIERLEIPLPHFISEIIGLFRVKAASKGIKVYVESPDQIPSVIHSDPTRLRQILTNLIGNAIKFTSKGFVSIRVDLRSSPAGSHTFFSIQDSGMGISPAQQMRLFQPFTQADNSTTRKFGGTGLGLTLSRKLANALGGDLRLVKSDLGKGSTFEFSVENGITAPCPSLPSVCKNGVEQDTASLAGLKILLAEDSLDNQILVKRILASYGADVECVDNGAAAVEKALHESYDIILMDIQMPVLDGYRATTQLRENGYRHPIIALTAHALKEDREKSLAIGCNGHLTKPLNRSLLVSILIQHSKKGQPAKRSSENY